ncbi:hypothetical protein EC991_000316 [Linnemannia zychae]|nr:hypothetical protein EC991_000316 [Linnemannia zychae]
MENNTNNNELAIATDMDLDDSMPLMSPNMPLTTIPEFEEEEENDVCPDDLRQYIMTDIGPQPSNSQVPALRSHLHLVRQRSYSKIGGTGFGGAGLGGGLHSPSSNGGISPLSPSSSMAKGFGMSISLSPTMTRRTSLQAQALVGQYGNGNAMMLMANGNTGSNDTSSNSHGSSLYGGVSTASLYQQRAGSSSMTDLATIPHDKAFERDLMALHHQHQQHPAAAWDL